MALKNTTVFNTLVHEMLGMSFKAFEAPIDFIHKEVMGAWLVWILVVGHICAALFLFL